MKDSFSSAEGTKGSPPFDEGSSMTQMIGNQGVNAFNYVAARVISLTVPHTHQWTNKLLQRSPLQRPWELKGSGLEKRPKCGYSPDIASMTAMRLKLQFRLTYTLN